MKLDKFLFWSVLLGYLLAIVLIFAIGANSNPTLSFG